MTDHHDVGARAIAVAPASGDAPPLAPVLASVALRAAEPYLGLRPALVVSDFDGTLSPIVLDPWGAAIIPSARRALRQLAGKRDVHVAILSGRTAADVASRARIGGAIYLGNHGLERGRLTRGARAGTIAVAVKPSPSVFADMAERLASEVPRLIPAEWLVVERKPPAVAFHYRGAADVDAAGVLVQQAVDALDPDAMLVRFPGRRVLELRPPGAPAKGEAMRELLDELRPAVAFMLGDDRSDALAFAVLRAARDAGEVAGMSIAVQARAETPASVAAAADLLLASPAEAARFLVRLAAQMIRA